MTVLYSSEPLHHPQAFLTFTLYFLALIFGLLLDFVNFPTMAKKDLSFSSFLSENPMIMSIDSTEVITTSPGPILLHYGLLEMVLKTV